MYCLNVTHLPSLDLIIDGSEKTIITCMFDSLNHGLQSLPLHVDTVLLLF